MRNFFTTSVLILILVCQIFAQSPNDIIDANTFNNKYLEYLTKQGIDSVRKVNGAPALFNDTILYLAARDHSIFLSKTNAVSHFQLGSKKKYSPQDRSNFYGAINYYVGENVMLTYVLIPVRSKEDAESHTVSTYGQAAAELVTGWVNSPNHYANLLTKTYRATGLAVSFEKTNNSLRAVQVFADVPVAYKPMKSKNLFPYDTKTAEEILAEQSGLQLPTKFEANEWGIKKPKSSIIPWFDTKKHSDAGKQIIRRMKGVQLQQNGSDLYLVFKDAQLAKSLFKKGKDGLAAEIVLRSDYKCDTSIFYTKPSRRNNMSLISGTTLEPVYKAQIEKQDKEQRQGSKKKIKGLKVYLGEVPKNLRGQDYEVNVLYLRKRALTHVLMFSSGCSEMLTYDTRSMFAAIHGKLLSTNQMNGLLSGDKLAYASDMRDIWVNPQSALDTIKAKIYFEKNSVDYKPEDIQPLIDALKQKDMFVLAAVVNAFASVEGTQEINHKLFTERAEKLIKAFQLRQDSTIKLKITTKENWELFFKQIKGLQKYQGLSKKDTTSIREFINLPENTAALEALLAEQRYALITFYISKKITTENRCDYLMEEYDNMVFDISKSVDEMRKKKTPLADINKKTNPKVAKLADIQIFLYSQFLKGKTTLDKLDKLGIPSDPIYNRLRFNKIMFDFMLSTNRTTNEQFFSQISDTTLFLVQPVKARYNYMAYLINHDDNPAYGDIIDAKSLENLLIRLEKSDIPQPQISAIRLYYHLKNCEEQMYTGDPKNALASLTYLHNLLATTPNIADSLKISFAKFFLLFGQYDWANELLQPMSQSDKPNHEALLLKLKIYYALVPERQASEFYDLLVESRATLSKEEWCSLFTGDCRLNFQIFDYEPLRNMYCTECEK